MRPPARTRFTWEGSELIGAAGGYQASPGKHPANGLAPSWPGGREGPTGWDGGFAGHHKVHWDLDWTFAVAWVLTISPAFSGMNETRVSSPGCARPLRVPMRAIRLIDIEV
jgi:hypothetical protein